MLALSVCRGFHRNSRDVALVAQAHELVDHMDTGACSPCMRGWVPSRGKQGVLAPGGRSPSLDPLGGSGHRTPARVCDI